MAAELPALIPLPRESASGAGRLVLGAEIGISTADPADAARLGPVLLKIPHRKSDWKWMITFIPVGDTAGMRYSSDLNSQ